MRPPRKTITIPVVLVMGILTSDCGHNTEELQTAEQKNQAIRLLQSAYDAFNRGDISGAVENLDPRIEWMEPASFPGGGTYHGQAGVARYLTQSRAGWAEGRSEPERFIVSGNRVIVFVHARIRMQGSSRMARHTTS